MEIDNGRKRVVISGVAPEIECGRFPAKRILGDEVIVEADIFADGHSSISANLLYRERSESNWKEAAMILVANDRWAGKFTVTALGRYEFTIHSWVDAFLSWQKELQKKFKAHLDLSLELRVGLEMIEEGLEQGEDSELANWLKSIEGARNQQEAVALASNGQLHALMRDKQSNKKWITEYLRPLSITVDPPKANFSTWYELFPRSCSSKEGEHGTLQECAGWLPEIAQMGFDVLYLTPIFPIGLAERRGRNRKLKALENDPGSPWAIRNHKAVHPQLGTVQDFELLIDRARELGIDIALDLAFQCSPDHSYLTEHSEWFKYRSDGSVQFAENPPKKYEDIVPFDFENENWKELWGELKSIVLFWIAKGIRIFRVDNPHTKPFSFWEWLIGEVKEKYPEVIFLSEAFTRPKVMYRLAKLGFSQSYTYFTWRNTKKELTEYVSQLTQTEIKEYFRPNFWPNTPDILPESLQQGGAAAFKSRLLLAATLSSNYGIYGPAFEWMVSEAIAGTEEYADAEKYEIKNWNWKTGGNLRECISQINRIRRENSALQCTSNVQFCEIDNDQILYYMKFNDSNTLLIFVNLDPFHPQSGTFKIPLQELKLDSKQSYRVQELLTARYFTWEGEVQKISVDPSSWPGAIYRVQREMRREADFDYFM